ncbi:MAG: alpha-N-acetylglucosaminidase N-terminal domain-containing protein, partial [Bacteroidales bacterium]|nr:alpha-N-acetylglucosaminidase N-terminal domain-containing protein [Bacteroidales bacterium]
MKNFLLISLSAIMVLAGCGRTDDGTPDAKAAAALAARVIPSHADDFTFKTLPADTCDYFTISQEGGKVAIGGNNANSMAVGL